VESLNDYKKLRTGFPKMCIPDLFSFSDDLFSMVPFDMEHVSEPMELPCVT